MHALLWLLILNCCCFSFSSSSNGGGSSGYGGAWKASLSSWELLISNSGVSAMHMMLLPSNKVVIFDRTDFGPSNITLPNGKCRHDPNDMALPVDCWAHSILFDISSTTIRPLTILTDTWCSSGGLDSSGNLIQTGGFNDGARSVRIFPGFCESCDWSETANLLSVNRWYASNQILPDNRIIIVGGRRQFNYEFFPKSHYGESVFRLPFLAETSDAVENNLYPFLHLSTDGNLFIFANAKSILLDYKSNIVLRKFPVMPGGEAHNYPSSGSSLMLPLFAANGFQFVDILVCGGAPPTSNIEANDGNFVPASRMCGRIRISDTNPVWIMDTMPMNRVMGDMLLLPTSDVLIINGAQRGTAGWGVARDPAFSPLLYDPYARKFDILSSSSTPRLYHSTAVLLPDGRILVGGGNPHINYDFTDPEFPTELSLEAFSPPYLNPQFSSFRPIITSLSTTSILYGSSFYLRFDVGTQVNVVNLQINMLLPPFTTHSYAMNQRMLRLRFGSTERLSETEFELVVEAPPTSVIAPAGYYLLFVVHSTIPSPGLWVRMQP